MRGRKPDLHTQLATAIASGKRLFGVGRQRKEVCTVCEGAGLKDSKHCPQCKGAGCYPYIPPHYKGGV